MSNFWTLFSLTGVNPSIQELSGAEKYSFTNCSQAYYQLPLVANLASKSLDDSPILRTPTNTKITQNIEPTLCPIPGIQQETFYNRKLLG